MTDTATGRKDQLTIGSVRLVEDLPVTITHSQPAPREAVEETCKTCHYWRRLAPGDPIGKCSIHEEDEGPVLLLVYGDDPAEYWTPENWHCAGYQRRPDGGE